MRELQNFETEYVRFKFHFRLNIHIIEYVTYKI